ncbi:cupin domain-containing protein [Bizionia myxarmorum]|uniref:Cupin domain-containing protein n=2 Tax=Bizionia myxarmorum TaxID=291186 RepID=A0A5D0R2X3_9FLAO|nr:cupin domain-containing protein [Bizionia myxarmorum]
MQANAGDLLPKHSADLESILFIHEGECVLTINDEDIILKQGDGFVIPPKTTHQIKVVSDFKGIHMMPIAIKFEFF